jgi:predicted NAD/FAD-binding protein
VRIAIVGGGISGLVCAHVLSRSHDVTLFESEGRLGGHTNTLSVAHEGRTIRVDTGFIVFNTRNYPKFVGLLATLGVESRPTTMSFSVHDESSGFEYGGASPAGVVGSFSNLLNARWWRTMLGIATLGTRGRHLLASLPHDATLASLRDSGLLNQQFMDGYLLPMASAIWSAPRADLLCFPARFVLRFFENHGMLDLRERPRWRTIVGGSGTYIEAMMRTMRITARTGEAVVEVRRNEGSIEVRTRHGERERFDHAILASHADESLGMLADASPGEREVLRAMPFQSNSAVLHSDERLLPARRRCWAAWNGRIPRDPARPASVTYNMSMLQGLETRTPLCVTLNDESAIDSSRVLWRGAYRHPLYTLEGERARARWHEISGLARTHYCGAYWGNGFHEDGVASALRVCDSLGEKP